ncbi:MAG TPA: zinc ribbon domain-containing protein [Dehalococcoidia bacterium]|nr:zinc ribbon domain-containing protein [Dehalococcoidia bacterium]
MSAEVRCPNCGSPLADENAACGECGHSPAGGPATFDASGPPDPEAGPSEPAEDRVHGGLHPLAPLVFAAAGIAVGFLMAAVFSPLLGVPLGFLGGGLGVWALERGRRILS